MNIVFLSVYGKNDTRTRAFIRILRKIGSLVCVTNKTEEKTDDVASSDDIEINYRGVRDTGKFISASYKAIKRFDHIDLLFLDNRMAAIPFLLFGRNSRYVIQDAREFYSIKDVRHLAGKIGCIFERKSLQRADMVLCANIQRARLMKERWKLSEMPFVYENIFPSQYDEHFDLKQAKNDYDNLFEDDKLVFISSAGCQIERTTDKLVLAAKKFEDRIKLLLVGGSSKKDAAIIQKIIEEEHISNISVIEHVDMNTLKYLMSKSNVGVVIYGKHDDNNRYCASGKIYEFLNEHLPMIASGNEPLVDFMNRTHTGIANDNYEEAIKTMLDHYTEYKDNAMRFYEMFDPDSGNRLLESEIVRRLRKGRSLLPNK